MTQGFDERLRDWITGQVPGAEVSLAAPQASPTGRGIGIYLLELIQAPLPSTTRRTPLQLILRYLVTTWGDDPEDAHKTLVQLAFAAMENKEFQLEMDSIPMTVWTAFGVAPRPSFVLRVPVQKERPEPETELVRQPPNVRTSPMVSFHGVLLGPGDLPLSDCVVEVPALKLSTSTDRKGRFCFAGMPPDGTKNLVVKAKGRVLPIASEKNYPDSKAPLVVHFSPLEE